MTSSSTLPSFCQAQVQTSSSCCDNSGPVHLTCWLLQGTSPFVVLERIVMTPTLHPNHNAMIPIMNINWVSFEEEEDEEDCLHCNVHIPKFDQSRKSAVGATD